VLAVTGRASLLVRVGDELAAGLKGARDTAASFARELYQRPRSLSGLLGSLAMVAVAVVLVALILLAVLASLVGVVLVVVLYAIGVWVVAWLLVREVARRVSNRRRAFPGQPRVRRLSLRRDVGELHCELASGPYAARLASLVDVRAVVELAPPAACQIALSFATTSNSERVDLHFSVAKIDREEEAAELCLRIARVVGLQAYAADRHRLLGLELDFLRTLPGQQAAHPFRAHAAEPRYRAVPAADEAATAFDQTLQRAHRAATSVRSGGAAGHALSCCNVEAGYPGRASCDRFIFTCAGSFEPSRCHSGRLRPPAERARDAQCRIWNRSTHSAPGQRSFLDPRTIKLFYRSLCRHRLALCVSSMVEATRRHGGDLRLDGQAAECSRRHEIRRGVRTRWPARDSIRRCRSALASREQRQRAAVHARSQDQRPRAGETLRDRAKRRGSGRPPPRAAVLDHRPRAVSRRGLALRERPSLALREKKQPRLLRSTIDWITSGSKTQIGCFRWPIEQRASLAQPNETTRCRFVVVPRDAWVLRARRDAMATEHAVAVRIEAIAATSHWPRFVNATETASSQEWAAKGSHVGRGPARSDCCRYARSRRDSIVKS